MEFQASTLWWVLAGVLVIAELLTGTFYLLMLALGSVAAAGAAHAGAAGTAQFVAAALVGGGATALWHFKRARAPRSAPAASNADVSPDIGQTVVVTVEPQREVQPCPRPRQTHRRRQTRDLEGHIGPAAHQNPQGKRHAYRNQPPRHQQIPSRW